MHRPELGALSGVILVYVVFYVLASDSGMFSLSGLVNIFQVSAEIGVLAVAAALLMIAGEFDLSMGSMVGFAGVTIGLCATTFELSLPLSILIAFALCLLIGAANGWLTVKTGLALVHRDIGLVADLARPRHCRDAAAQWLYPDFQHYGERS